MAQRSVELGGGEPAEIVINLPENKELVEKLTKKLAEYRERQEDIERRRGGGAPEQNEPLLAKARGLHYKTTVLERLLQGGAVSSEMLRSQMRQEDGEAFNEADFDNAVGVIDAYANDREFTLDGGTGLK